MKSAGTLFSESFSHVGGAVTMSVSLDTKEIQEKGVISVQDVN